MTETVNPIHECEAPFPRLGEVYRALALALGTKNRDRELDAFARDEKYDWRIPRRIRQELFDEPLRPLFRTHVGQGVLKTFYEALAEVERLYLASVRSVQVDFLRRGQVQGVLLKHFFSLLLGSFLWDLQTRGEVVDRANLVRMWEAPDTALAVILEVFSRRCGADLVTAVYPGSTGLEKRQKENLNRWIKGAFVPDLSSIKAFLVDVRAFMLNQEGVRLSDEHIDELAVWMVVARACLAYPESELWRGSLRNWNNSFSDRQKDPFREIKWLELIEGQKSGLRDHARAMLDDELSGMKTKKPGAQSEAWDKLEELLVALDHRYPDGRLDHYKYWLQARWYVLSGQPASALPGYQRALKTAWYRAGEVQIKILQEAMMVAAYAHYFKKEIGDEETIPDGKVSARSFLKSLKNKAVHFEVFPKPDDSQRGSEAPEAEAGLPWEWGAEGVADWEIEDWARCFCRHFPPSAWFAETKGKETAPILDPMLSWDKDRIKKIRPRLDKPRYRVQVPFHDATRRKLPQICFFTTFGDVADVKALLDQDPSLMKELDKQDGSVLLRALQRVMNVCTDPVLHDQERRMLDLILSYPHEPRVLNGRTVRKQLSPVHLAVEYGDPGIVRRLLALGANPGLIDGVYGVQPLGCCASLLCPSERVFAAMLEQSDKNGQDLAEFVRRHANFSDLLPGLNLGAWLKKPGFKDKFVKASDLMLYSLKGREQWRKDMLEIARILLEAGNDPNHPAAAHIRGYTPLMLAAEMDDVELFDLLVRHGGDPERTCEMVVHGKRMDLDSRAIARKWDSTRILAHLERRNSTGRED